MATINPNKVLIRGSNTAGVEPSALSEGTDDTETTSGAATEIAINRADSKLFYLDSDDAVAAKFLAPELTKELDPAKNNIFLFFLSFKINFKFFILFFPMNSFFEVIIFL